VERAGYRPASFVDLFENIEPLGKKSGLTHHLGLYHLKSGCRNPSWREYSGEPGDLAGRRIGNL
jgi:hypothetical protein